MQDFLFRGELAALDPDVADLINLEAERQIRRLIMIPSESTIPWAVREALTSQFHNIYAEGYPPEEMRQMSEEDLLDFDARLADYRRYGDPRYYKGTEFANLIESLARRRAAELFATPSYDANKLFVNVQPLSGAPVNSAVYTALIQPGDVIMGLDLLHGGHLSHGSPVARSGKQYKAVYYSVNPDTDLLDYDQALQVARTNRPKIVIGGYTSYPWAPDWDQLRAIADDVGAYLLADVSHVSGLIVAGLYPNPVGIADIVTFTTHKTLGGPRGAVMITHKSDLAKKLDRGVFPGEQGGPHVNSIAALAVSLKLAATPQFKELQVQTVKNAVRLAAQISAHGLRIQHGGTDTHLLLVDLKSIRGEDRTPLGGDMAVRLLDLIGITSNRNTLPGDKTAARPTGVRLGTPWITQRGFREPHIDRLATVIATVLKACKPFSYDGKGGKADWRAKIDFDTYVEAAREVSRLCDEAGIDYETPVVGDWMPIAGRSHLYALAMSAADMSGPAAIIVKGAKAPEFLFNVLTSSVMNVRGDAIQKTLVLKMDGSVFSAAMLARQTPDTYTLYVARQGPLVAEWLRALSDGFVIYDPTDLYGKLPGPVAVVLSEESVPDSIAQELRTLHPDDALYEMGKPYFVGCHGAHYGGPACAALPSFNWAEPTEAPLKRTTSFETHKALGAKMVPFAGYDMPVWYTSVSEEHAAVRTAAGLFDVTHMGVWELRGPASEMFLNAISTNDVSALEPGQSHYSYLLGLNGVPLDDIYIYRLAADRFMIVVNASNNDQDWAWVNAVRTGKVQIDPDRPGAVVLVHPDHFTLRDLRAPQSGADQRVDLALQGPKSRDVLLSLGGSEADKAKLKALPWSAVTQVTLAGFDLIVSRTGYTGERTAFELFAHPDQAPALFKALVEKGAIPCGLASRDSTRIEAGLPLYGHELGAHDFTPGDAGFASYVKLWKPFFIGKKNYLAREAARESIVARFRMDAKGVKPPQGGDPVLDKRGRVVGFVTSCSIDSDGYQLGQAWIKEELAEDGTPILIFSGVARSKDGKPLAELRPGDKATIPDAATVLSRFPKKKT